MLNGNQAPLVSRGLHPEPRIDYHEEHNHSDHPFPWQGPAQVFPESLSFITP